MSALPSLLVISLLQAEPVPAPPKGDIAVGAISYLTSKRCEEVRNAAETDFMVWPSLTYAAGRPPMWGDRKFSKCGGGTWIYALSLAAGAYWSQTSHDEIIASPGKTMWDDEKTVATFMTMFGWEVPNQEETPPHLFNKYESKKLKKLFDQAYVKPADTVGGYTAQQVYDRIFKEYVAKFARDAAFINKRVPKAKLGKLLKAYQAAAKDKGSQFNGPQYLKELAITDMPQGEDRATAGNGRALGVILRRTADGTWPTIAGILKTVVKDYDPELFKEIGKKL